MVRFNCMSGWCHRTGIVLDGLPLLTIQRCFTTQTCPLCWGTKPAPMTLTAVRRPSSTTAVATAHRAEERKLVIGGGVQGVKRFKRTHPRLAGYLGNRRPTLLHGMRMKVTTCDRGERTARGGEDLSDDGGGDGDDGDDDDDGGAAQDVGFVDAPMPDADADAALLLLADDEGAASDDSSEVLPQHTLDDDDDDGVRGDDEGDDDADECEGDDCDADASSAAAEAEVAEDAGDQCIVCARGWRYPLCRQCASNIRKRARVLLKI